MSSLLPMAAGGTPPPASSSAIAKAFISMRRLRDNPETFHKMCQVTVAAIGLVGCAFSGISTRFEKIVLILQTADMHYFYGFLKLPFQMSYPINADTLDVGQTAANIAWEVGAELGRVTTVLNDEVTRMRGGSDSTGAYRTSFGYASEQEFITAVNHRFSLVAIPLISTTATPDTEGSSVTGGARALVAYHTRSLAERVNTVLWAFADISTVAFFLNIWKLVDTAKMAAAIGQLPAMSWMKHQVLESWIWGVCALAHGLNAGMSIAKYFAAAEGTLERTYAKRDAMVSIAETIFNGTCFINSLCGRKIPQSLIFTLAIIAKGSGLWNIVNRWD